MPGFDELYTSDAKKLFDSNDAELLVQGDGLSIGFCVSSAEENRLDKTGFLSAYEWIGGTLREKSSIVAPTITIEYKGFPNWNYAYIPNFNRYYFITDIVSVNLNVWMIAFRVDPLMSYKEIIKDTRAMVERNENTFDAFMLDEMYPPKYNKQVTENWITDVLGFSPDIVFRPDMDLTYRPHVVVTTYNTRFTNTGADLNPPDPNYLPEIWANNFISGIGYKTYALDYLQSKKLTLDLFNNSGHASFVISIIVYPYEIKTSGSYQMAIGSGIVEGMENVPGVETPFIPYAVINDFVMDRARSFLDFEPYTTRELYIPYAGWYKIPFEVCAGHEILVYYSIDQIQGNATAFVYDKTSHRILWSTPCQLGIKIPVSTTNNLENEKAESANNLNLIMSIVSSAASIGIGVATANPVATTAGVIAGAKGLTSYINHMNSIVDRAQATAASAMTSMASLQKCRIRKTRNFTDEYDQDFCREFGKPLRQIRRIGELTGFTVLGSAHMEIPGAYPDEVSAVESILKEGFIA